MELKKHDLVSMKIISNAFDEEMPAEKAFSLAGRNQSMSMSKATRIQFLVHSPSLAESLSRGLRDYDIDAEAVAEEEALLASLDPFHGPDCYLFEMSAPDHRGLPLLQTLKRRGVEDPVLIVSEKPDVRTAVNAIKLGAADFLAEPAEIGKVAEAIRAAAQQAATRPRLTVGAGVFARLTNRQAEILLLTASGLTSKEIARELNISHRTVENYRAHAMDRLGLSRRTDMIRLVLESVRSISTPGGKRVGRSPALPAKSARSSKPKG